LFFPPAGSRLCGNNFSEAGFSTYYNAGVRKQELQRQNFRDTAGEAGMENRDLLGFAMDVARGAGEILRRNYGAEQCVHYKGEVNLVTDVDRRSEEYIIGRIRSAFPDHGILSEESSEILSPSAFRWIVDPLDGTTNYAHGYPCFCVSIAVERDGKVLAGAVYDPLREELFTSAAGEGAHLKGTPIKVSTTGKLRQSLLATGFAYDVNTAEDTNLANFREFVFTGQAIRRDGSAALDLCYLACGRFDGFWELSLKPWDTAAGLLILAEAGGVATRLDGSPYNVHHPDILASNGKIHEQMLEVIRRAKR
jgi:myo-inositol-1(or 4)-monophosphatase